MEGAARGLTAAATGRESSRELRHLRRLFGYLRPYRWTVVGTLVSLVVAASAVLVLGVGLCHLIDGGFGAGRAEALDHALKAVLVLVAVLAAATYARSYLVSWLGERVVADIRRQVYDRVIGLSPGFFEVTRTGEVLSRLTAAFDHPAHRAGPGGVDLGVDLQVQGVPLLAPGRAGLVGRPVGHDHGDLVVVGMDVLLHDGFPPARAVAI